MCLVFFQFCLYVLLIPAFLTWQKNKNNNKNALFFIVAVVPKSVNQYCYFLCVIFRSDANKHAPGIHEIREKAGTLDRIAPKSKILGVTGESKVPFSMGIVPRKGRTLPKPTWHAPWKLMRVSTLIIIISVQIFTVSYKY